MNTMIRVNRIEVIDALRGFAIISILLLHNLEHFDLYFLPEQLPSWMKIVDKKVWDSLFFLFGGKSYSIFAILFGFTFYLQQSKQKERGNDFSWRFAWRMFLLFGFGIFNTGFYVGDILLFYSMIGFILIPVRNLRTGVVFGIALFLLLQPAEWIKLLLEWNNYPLVPIHEISAPYWESLHKTMKDPSFITMVKGNFYGKIGHLLWFWSDGRVSQTAGLFLIGFLLGRMKLFYPKPENRRFWIKTLIIATIVFLPLYYFNLKTHEILKHTIHLWSNLCFTFILMGGFILLYQTVFRKVLSLFTPLGKMSLTSYVMQSIFGSFIYYGYGLGLYQFTGASICVCIGLFLGVIQWLYCKWWLTSHKQGPLEKIWHTLTWI